jgi:hypothetical protein
MPRPTSQPAETTTSVNRKSEWPFVCEDANEIQMQPAAIASAAAACRSGRWAPAVYRATSAISSGESGLRSETPSADSAAIAPSVTATTTSGAARRQ